MDSEDFEGIRSVVRDFVRTTVVPVENEIDERDEVPADIREAAKKMGLFGFALPEVYGGLGLSMEEESRLVFELGLHHTGAPLDVRHQQRHRRPRADGGRHRGPEGGVAAQARLGRARRLVRPDRDRRRFGSVGPDHHRGPRRRRVGDQRRQALHHQCAARRRLHGVRPHRPGRQGDPGHLHLPGPAGHPGL